VIGCVKVVIVCVIVSRAVESTVLKAADEPRHLPIGIDDVIWIR